jgi:hypothetical protein
MMSEAGKTRDETPIAHGRPPIFHRAPCTSIGSPRHACRRLVRQAVACPAPDRLEFVHDRRLVLASALQAGSACRRHLRQLLAFVEYCLAVPANRYGYGVYSAAELKTIQEVVTLSVFAAFSVVYLKEPLDWNHAVGFALISAGAFFIFQKW